MYISVHASKKGSRISTNEKREEQSNIHNEWKPLTVNDSNSLDSKVIDLGLLSGEQSLEPYSTPALNTFHAL